MTSAQITSPEHQKILLQSSLMPKSPSYTKVTFYATVSIEEYKEPSFNSLLGSILQSYLRGLNLKLPKLLAAWERDSLPDNIEESNLEEAMNSKSEPGNSTSAEQWNFLLSKIDQLVYSIKES